MLYGENPDCSNTVLVRLSFSFRKLTYFSSSGDLVIFWLRFPVVHSFCCSQGLTYGEFRKLLQQFLNADIGETLTQSLFDSFRDAPAPGCGSPGSHVFAKSGSRTQMEAHVAGRRNSRTTPSEDSTSTSSVTGSATAAAVSLIGTTGALMATANATTG